ncbi:MAG: hypothetical protein JWQ15_1223, partial [Marmoricola sp.]|nr:hypothetical protein [Marmoricola sp.]
MCAQLEAVRSGHPEPAYDDPGRPHDVQVAEGTYSVSSASTSVRAETSMT